MTDKISNAGLLRLPQVLELIPISKSAWWLGVKDGRFPQPIKLGAKTTVWKTQDVLDLIARLASPPSSAVRHPHPR